MHKHRRHTAIGLWVTPLGGHRETTACGYPSQIPTQSWCPSTVCRSERTIAQGHTQLRSLVACRSESAG